jgi:glycolate oxidase iron-sulfur subunit
MQACPVYAQIRHEGSVARGKIALIDLLRQDRLPLKSDLEYFLSACLLCGRCTYGCPNEVDTPALVQAARAELARANIGKRLLRWMLRRLLPSARLPTLLKTARRGRWLWAKKVSKDSGLHIRFSKGPQKERHRIFPLAGQFFFDTAKDTKPVANRPHVALFVGLSETRSRPGRSRGSTTSRL